MVKRDPEFDAAYVDGDLDECRRLLEQNPYLLDYDMPPYTYVHRAAQEGRVDFLQMAHDLGLPVNLPCERAIPLFSAGQAGQVEAVAFLLEHDNSPLYPGPYGDTPILSDLIHLWHHADPKPYPIANLVEIVKLFIAHGLPILLHHPDMYVRPKMPYAKALALAHAHPGFATAQIVAIMQADANRRASLMRPDPEARDEERRKEQDRLRQEKEDEAKRELKLLQDWIRWNHRFRDLIDNGPRQHKHSMEAAMYIADLNFQRFKQIPEQSPEDFLAALIAELEGRNG